MPLAGAYFGKRQQGHLLHRVKKHAARVASLEALYVHHRLYVSKQKRSKSHQLLASLRVSYPPQLLGDNAGGNSSFTVGWALANTDLASAG